MTGPGTSTRGDGQSGVTLVEILAALLVVALTLTLAANGLRLTVRGGDRGAQVVAAHEALSRGLDVLRRDIERRERVVWKQGEALEFVFRGDATGMTFVAIEPAFPTEPGPHFIVYAILQRRDGAALLRSRAPYHTGVADLARLATSDTVAIIEGPYRLRFQYLDKTDARERWVTEWTDRTRLPDLVSLEVAALHDDGRPMPQLVFRSRIDAERSCVKDDEGSCTLGTQGVLADDGGGR